MDLISDFIKKVLDIIDYSGDRDAFVRKFTNTIYIQATISLVDQLPEEKRNEFADSDIKLEDSARVDEFLAENLSREQILQAYELASADLFGKYIETIEPSLNEKQRKDLADLLESLDSSK